MGRKLGTVIISPVVLTTVARMTTLSVPGVVRMSSQGMRPLLGGQTEDGVKVQIVDDAVVLDLYLVTSPTVNLLALSREVQAKVTRAIHDIVGMPVHEVNVHVVDVTDMASPDE